MIPPASIAEDVLFQFKKINCVLAMFHFMFELSDIKNSTYLFCTPTNKTFLVLYSIIVAYLLNCLKNNNII